ncbi:hypothetical protein MGH68_03675 [Erysipelothrix sp. D19-032]
MVVNPLVEDSRALSPSNPVFTAKRSDVVSPMETVANPFYPTPTDGTYAFYYTLITFTDDSKNCLLWSNCKL